MFWSLGGLYLLGLQTLACASFAWGRWIDPSLAWGSGFWIAGGATLFLGLCGLAFETVNLFWSGPGSGSAWWTAVLRGIAYVGVAAAAGWGLWPFAEAAGIRLVLTGSL